jgi:hypothetical protein
LDRHRPRRRFLSMIALLAGIAALAAGEARSSRAEEVKVRPNTTNLLTCPKARKTGEIIARDGVRVGSLNSSLNCTGVPEGPCAHAE